LSQGISKLQESEFPLNYGYNRIFNCGDSVSSILVIPGRFAMAFGFVLPYGKLVQSLTNSNIFPALFDVKNNVSPNHAMIIATVISFIFCLMGLISTKISSSLNNIAILAEFLTNMCTLVGYVLLKIKFSGINRKFESPFGICGAIFSFIIFLLGIVSLVGDFQNDGGVSAIIVFGIGVFLSFYYFLYAKKIQTFSIDEQQSLFKFHVINLNKEKKRLMKSKNAQKRLSFSFIIFHFTIQYIKF
jgi:amino acid transporter